MKKIIKYALCLLIGLLVLLPVNSFAKESRLHDETGQLSNDEYYQILTMLDAIVASSFKNRCCLPSFR